MTSNTPAGTPAGTPVHTPAASAQTAARASSSEDRALFGRGISTATIPPTDTYQGGGGYPAAVPSSVATVAVQYNPTLRKVPGNPKHQAIRHVVGFDQAQYTEIYSWIKAVNKAAAVVLKAVEINQADYQITYGPVDGVESFQNGERPIPHGIAMALYMGDLHLAGIGRKECQMDPNADTSRDIELPFMIEDKYTCFIRGTISGGHDKVNAALCGHTCDSANTAFCRLSVENSTEDLEIECDFQSDSEVSDCELSDEEAESIQSSASGTPKRKKAASVQIEDDMAPSAGEWTPLDTRSILERQGVKFVHALDPSVTQAVIPLITTFEVVPFEAILTTYNSEAQKKGSKGLFWNDHVWDGITPPNRIFRACQCSVATNRIMAEQENARIHLKYPDDPSKRSSDDPDNWTSLKEIAKGENLGLSAETQFEDTDDVVGDRTCHYGRWRFEKIPSAKELARSTRVKEEIINALHEQSVSQQENLKTFVDILDALRTAPCPKAPQVIFDFLGFPELDGELNLLLKGSLIEEVNARLAPIVLMAQQNHEKYNIVASLDPETIGGCQHFNGGKIIPANSMAGFYQGVVMPSSKVPQKYRHGAVILPVFVFGKHASLVAIGKENNPIAKYDASNFSHSCLGRLAAESFNEHGSDTAVHEPCLGKRLVERLQAPMDCLRHLPEEHQYHAADFLFPLYTVGHINPLEPICLNWTETRHEVTQVAVIGAMPQEWPLLPPGSFALPCDCCFPYRCPKKAFVIRSEHLHAHDMHRPNHYTTKTTKYDNWNSKDFIRRHEDERDSLNWSGSSYRDTLQVKYADTSTELILSMASGSLAFGVDDYKPGVDDYKPGVDDYKPDVGKAMDLKSEFDSEPPVVRGTKPLRLIVPTNSKNPRSKPELSEAERTAPSPVRQSAIKRRRDIDDLLEEEPTTTKGDSVGPGSPKPGSPKVCSPKVCSPKPGSPKPGSPKPGSPNLIPKAKKAKIVEIRGTCPECGKSVMSNQERIKTDTSGIYYHKACYDTAQAAGNVGK